MKRTIALVVALSFILSGCANIAGLAGLAATGYGIYRAVKNE